MLLGEHLCVTALMGREKKKQEAELITDSFLKTVLEHC